MVILGQNFRDQTNCSDRHITAKEKVENEREPPTRARGFDAAV